MSFDTTTKYNLRKPNLDQGADFEVILDNLANDVDAAMVGYGIGLHSARPAASKAGKLYYETDTSTMFMDDGSTWKTIGANNRVGLLGAIPAANTVSVGTEYFATDQVAKFISDGTNWIRISPPAGSTMICLATTADSGYILLQGQAWPGTTGIYADIYARLGSPATVPDFRTFVPVGFKTSDADFGTLNGNGGERSHTLTAAEIQHHHSVTVPSETVPNAGVQDFPAGQAGSVNTGAVSLDSPGAHNNNMLYKTVNFQAKL